LFVVSVMAVGAGIGVDPEFRKQGVGEQILAAEEEAAKELGCWTFGGVVHPGNQASWRLFMRRAFVVASRMPTLVKTLTRRNGGQ
jgi:L-amino acid N-acyltransferase YncA